MSSSDRFYEWMLSDAPAAADERMRRRTESRRRSTEEGARVAEWCQRTLANPAASDDLRALAEVMQRVKQRQDAELAAADAVPEHERLQLARWHLEADRRALGDTDYHYPPSYLGTAAEHAPMPDEPVPVTAIEPGYKIRIRPGGAPVEIAAAVAVDGEVNIAATDGQQWRCPPSSTLMRVHDDRFAPDLARDRTRRPDLGAVRDLGHDL